MSRRELPADCDLHPAVGAIPAVAANCVRIVLRCAGALRRLARNARDELDRCLHPVRRRLAHSRLHRLAPRSILLVCDGNSYRSPFAAGVLRNGLRDRGAAAIRVSSGGFYDEGRRAPADAMEEAHRYAVDLRGHRSMRLTTALLLASDAIVVVEPSQRALLRARFHLSPRPTFLLGDFDPEPIRTRTLDDLWGRPYPVLVATYARMTRCAEALACTLSTQPARPRRAARGAEGAPARPPPRTPRPGFSSAPPEFSGRVAFARQQSCGANNGRAEESRAGSAATRAARS